MKTLQAFGQLLSINLVSNSIINNGVAGSWTTDARGRPRIFVHGTAADIQAFDLRHKDRKDAGWLGDGVYLTDDVDLADWYGTMLTLRTGTRATRERTRS